ncbi:MAG: hypothetical protein JSW34_11545 [Candidatus Zixiibacteriota bacterium]|nr:MAG: hypothetical protein JSW34_11545 [candidate division Zixibacteria bacterium]
MKTKILVMILMLAAFLLAGCDNDDDVLVVDFSPAAPQGIYSVTGDNAVYLYWNGPYENDIVRYILWRSFDPITNYTELGVVDAVPNPDLDLLIYEYIDGTAQNGITYYYAVSSVDASGQVSDLSAENVFDTPRPEGIVGLYDFAVEPDSSGFNFALHRRVSFDSEIADVYVDWVNGTFYVNAANSGTDLQDVGFTESFDEIGWAPQGGWSENGWLEVILGHTYVIWTSDLHYAKMWVVDINQTSVNFVWAYQTDEDNPELKPVATAVEKPVHGPDYLVKDLSSPESK